MKLLRGFSDTFNILAVKWNGLRNRSKIVIILAAIAFAFFTYSIANAGSIIIFIATNLDAAGSNNQLARDFVLEYLQTFQKGELNLYVTGVLGSTVGMILFAPFSGYSISSIVPNRDLAIIKANDNYRLSDSIIVQLLSALTLIQFISLTILASLTTLEGGTGPAVLWSWALWLSIVMLATTFMWVIEYVNRKYGKWTKIFILVGVFILIGAAILIDPFKGTTAFGLSPIVINVLQNIHSYDFLGVVFAYSVPLLLVVLFGAALSFIGSRTLNIQEPVNLKKKKKVAAQEKYTNISLFQVCSTLIFRYKVIWRPILITASFSLLLVFILGSVENTQDSMMISIIAIIPLVVSLSFGVNIFGILGSSNIWLSSLPGWRQKILPTVAALQAAVILSIYVIIFLVGGLTGRIPLFSLFSAIPAVLAATLIMVVYSVGRSLKNPIKYMAASRGDSILPPLTMLNYMMRMMLFGGIPGILVYNAGPQTAWQLLGVIAALCLYVFYRQQKSFVEKEEYVNSIIKKTTTD